MQPKVVILCGGLGTRLKEETEFKPKPMVEIGGKPILWHIMKIYAHYGFNEFIISIGYKGEMIKDYFLNYFYRNNDFTIDLANNSSVEIHYQETEDWKVTIVDTGLETLTGGRIKLVENYIKGDYFMATYGDGLANIDVRELVNFHKSHEKIATVTSVRPASRFGELVLNGKQVREFSEKPQVSAAWINGGFFVFRREFLNYLSGSQSVLEEEPLEILARENQLMAYEHFGYWRCMDTYRDMETLNKEWASGKAPWKVW